MEKTRMARKMESRRSHNPHKTQHKTMKRTILLVAVVVVGLAWLDVSTGIQMIDNLLDAVPIDLLRRLIEQ